MNLKEFSERLGLSPTTVSRALGGYPEVKEETRRKVAEAAVALGYSPNRRAAALATGRAMAIGHVITTSAGNEMVNPVFADFLAGAGEVYAAAGYDLLLSVAGPGKEADAYRAMAAARSVDGVIVHGPRLGDDRIELLREMGLPFVVHGRLPGARTDYDFVDVDNVRAFRKATEHLIELGHRRIALLNGQLHMDYARRRGMGYASAMEAAGLPVDPALTFAGEMTEANGHDAARDMLARAPAPTAFLVSSLIMAIGVRRAVEAAGLRLGRDVSVVTHDDVLGYLGNGDAVPIFTATRSSVRAAGMRCAEIVLDRVSHPGADPVQEVWESELVRGASTCPAPQT